MPHRAASVRAWSEHYLWEQESFELSVRLIKNLHYLAADAGDWPSDTSRSVSRIGIRISVSDDRVTHWRATAELSLHI